MSNKPMAIFNLAVDSEKDKPSVRAWLEGYCLAGNIKLSGKGIENIKVEVDQDEAAYMLTCLIDLAEENNFYIAGGYAMV